MFHGIKSARIKLCIWLALTILILAIPLTLNKGITGAAIATTIYPSALTVTRSRAFSLETGTDTITSLGISGTVHGEGRAELLLSDLQGNTRRIYRNIARNPSLSMLTGTFAALTPTPQAAANMNDLRIMPLADPIDSPSDIPRGYVLTRGKFFAACEETCAMDGGFGAGEYILTVKLDERTTIDLDSISVARAAQR